MPDPVLVTGAAGFIGFHVAERLLREGRQVVGIDNVNSYYDPALKEARLDILRNHPGFTFRRVDISETAPMEELFATGSFGPVVHLAAQAGVRYSLQNPRAYVDSNLVGFTNILEGCRRRQTPHLIYASSSSVYGSNTSLPFSVEQNVDHPISLYAATKKANELMAHTYSHLFGLPTTGLRFFTVYGPWGRPDMAMFIFATAILEGRPLQMFNYGRMRRDFTYIDDVVELVVRLVEHVPAGDPDWDSSHPDPATSRAPYRVYNIGNNHPEQVSRVVDLLEQEIGRKAIRELVPIQPGDVEATYADVDALARDIGFRPSTSIEEGIDRFIAWYRDYRAGDR